MGGRFGHDNRMKKTLRVTSRLTRKPDALSISIALVASDIVQVAIYLESSPSLSAHFECPVQELPIDVHDLGLKTPVFIERLEEKNRPPLNALCGREIRILIDGQELILKTAGSISDFIGSQTPFGARLKSGACAFNEQGARIFNLDAERYWHEGDELSGCAEVLDGYKIGAILPSLQRAVVPTWSALIDEDGALVGGLIHWEEVPHSLVWRFPRWHIATTGLLNIC